jgi:transcriptional regulator with XRE-family HTH domain
MLHAPILIRPAPAPVLFGEPAPLTPSDYVRLRRKAAGITIEQAAERIGFALFMQRGRSSVKANTLAEIRALLRQLETPGVVARAYATIERLACGFPIDADVYRQLATASADQHPRICRGCGCSQNDACRRDGAAPCAPAGLNICTRCTDGESL